MCVFTISSQTLWFTEHKFSGCNGNYLGVVWNEFGEEWSKIPPIELKKALDHETLGVTWGLASCKTKNLKEGILIKRLNLDNHIHEPLYICIGVTRGTF